MPKTVVYPRRQRPPWGGRRSAHLGLKGVPESGWGRCKHINDPPRRFQGGRGLYGRLADDGDVGVGMNRNVKQFFTAGHHDHRAVHGVAVPVGGYRHTGEKRR